MGSLDLAETGCGGLRFLSKKPRPNCLVGGVISYKNSHYAELGVRAILPGNG